MLKLSRSTITHVIHLYTKFLESETHQFKREIVIVACTYLACKINEEVRKIRDILNMVSEVTGLYKKVNQKIIQEKGLTEMTIDYVSLESLLDEKDESYLIDHISNFSLEKYTKMRDEILKAEQHLLKILNFNLENPYEVHYKLMIAYLAQPKFLPAKAEKVAFAVFNDSYFIMDESDFTISYRIPFCVLLGCKIYKIKYDNQSDLREEEKQVLKKFGEQEQFTSKFKKFCEEILKYYDELGESEQRFGPGTIQTN